jgi:uncharacterized membrane protein YdfJ with MMPL/SSD domain
MPVASQPRSGLPLAGLVLAIFIFPVGLIFSLVALVQTIRLNQKGKLLATLGIVIALAELAVLVVVVMTVGQNVSTIVDPGCTQGKEVILADGDLGDSDDPEVVLATIGTVVTGLDEAAAKANHDDVRAALQALSADYKEYGEALERGSFPSSDLLTRLVDDANAIDELCTIGGAES